MRPFCHHGRLPHSVLGLLDILVIPTSACFTPEYRLPGVLQMPNRRGGQGTPVPGTLGVALGRARRAQVAAVVLCRARAGQLVALLRGWRELASRCPRPRWRLVRRLVLKNRRVDPLGWWVRVVISWSVLYLVIGALLRKFSPSRVAGSQA